MIDDLIPDRDYHKPVLFEATFFADVAAVDQPAYLVVPAFDTQQRFGPAPWPTRSDPGGLVLPSRGDRALVAFGDNDDPWVVMWWPY